MRLCIILFFLLASCKTVKKSDKYNSEIKLKYYSESCHQYVDYSRKYVNDSIYIEKIGSSVNSLVMKGGELFVLIEGNSYKIIDTEEDFVKKKKSIRYYFYGLNTADTIKKDSESVIQHDIRLQESVIVLIPYKETMINNRKVFQYYFISECYPVSDYKCLESKIANGQYTVLYFENEVGYVGYKVGRSGCQFMITSESYRQISAKGD